MIWAVDSYPKMYANGVFLESIIFNPSIIFVTNKPPFFHIEISSLMLRAGWHSSKTSAAGTPAGFIHHISAHIFLTRLWKHDIDQREWSPLKQRVYPQTISWVIREESFMGLIVAEQQQRNWKCII